MTDSTLFRVEYCEPSANGFDGFKFIWECIACAGLNVTLVILPTDDIYDIRKIDWCTDCNREHFIIANGRWSVVDREEDEEGWRVMEELEFEGMRIDLA